MRKLLLALALLAAPLPALAQAPAGADAGAAFMAKNKATPGVITLPDGLQYKVLAKGPANGGSPTPADLIAVDYEGKLIDGATFDQSDEDGPAVLALGALIPAWVEVIQMMHPGDQWMIWSPPALAYGAEASGPIPANRFQLMPQPGASAAIRCSALR